MKRQINKYRYLFLITASILIIACSPQNPEQQKEIRDKTLRRSESFFGLHFDFHASKNDSAIGKSFSAEMIDSLLTMVQPDYIQVDCKGHPGISSYPTKVGNPASGFIKDPMKIWREVTKKHNVALYVHYSGVWDIESSVKHPDWMSINRNGKWNDGKMSVKGPYVDSLLIPQFKELIDNYDIDGCWIDGECWALATDYSPEMLEAFRAETGIQDIPRSFSDPGGYEFYEFNRKAFREYLTHYTRELHQYDPDFQITSNWAFSSLMPEPVDVNIDFISGDFSHENSVYSGLYESRCIAPQGKPWDLMAWSFNYDFGKGVPVTKSAIQLKQLASTVLSMGGGYQVYFQQNRDASPQPWQFGIMKEVASFCRERQPYCQEANPLHQIALLYSTEDYKKNSGRLYRSSSFNNRLKGILNLLLDKQNAVEIVMEHHLTGKMQEYPLIVIPECEYLSESFKKELVSYVEKGGNLLVIGSKTTQMFSEQLNVEFQDTIIQNTKFISFNNELAGINTNFNPVTLNQGAEPCGTLYTTSDFRFPSSTAASVASLGKGKIAGVYFDVANQYLSAANPVYRGMVDDIVKRLFPTPLVEVEGSEKVVVTVNDLKGKIAVNLINISGDHSNVKVARYNEIPSVGPLEIKVRLDERPEKVTLQPENIALDFTFSSGIMNAAINQLDVYSIVVIE